MVKSLSIKCPSNPNPPDRGPRRSPLGDVSGRSATDGHSAVTVVVVVVVVVDVVVIVLVLVDFACYVSRIWLYVTVCYCYCYRHWYRC